MDKFKYFCGHCNSGYSHKSSLKRHINSAHNNRRYVCSVCQKEYIRKPDFISHMSKFHQPLIVKQSNNNISFSPSTAHMQNTPSTSKHFIKATTDLLTGVTDWDTILRNDLALSDEEEPVNPRVSIGTSTDISKNPDTSKEVNTSPLAILDMGSPKFLNTHSLPDEAKVELKIIPKPTTQIGRVPSTLIKNQGSQTDTPTKCTHATSQTESEPCKECLYQEHLILQRQSYIIRDAELNTDSHYQPPITSREDRSTMPIPGSTRHTKWLHRFHPFLKPVSPGQYQKPKSPPQFTKPELKITSEHQTRISTVRKPSALTIDHDTYLAICSRKQTRPTLVISPRTLNLPPPPANNAWTYRTTKF